MSCNPKKKWLQPGKEKNRLQRIRYPASIIGVSCFFSVVYLLPAPWRCVSLLSLRNRALNVCEVLQVWMMSTWKTLLTIFGSWLAICWNSDMACKGFFFKIGYLVKEEDTVICLLLNHEFKIGGMGSGQTLKSWHFTCQHGSRRQIPKTPGAKRYRLDHWIQYDVVCFWRCYAGEWVGFHLGFLAEIHQTSIVVEVSRRKTNKREDQRPEPGKCYQTLGILEKNWQKKAPKLRLKMWIFGGCKFKFQ